MKGVNVIEPFESIEQSVQETRLERGKRTRQQRRRRWGMMSVAMLTAFSTTVLLGVESSRMTNSLFTAEVANASSVTAGNLCAEDTHQNGEKHKPHPPGEGKGHCKPHGDDKKQDRSEQPPAEAPAQQPADAATESKR